MHENFQKITIILDGSSYDISISYRPGSEDLIIFLHGLGCSKDSFRDVWGYESFAGYSLLSFDFPGFGYSAKPYKFSYSMEDHARVCEEVIKNFPEHRLHIVAHSMGGAVGLLLSDTLLSFAVSFVNVEGNLASDDCGFVSRETMGVPYDIFERELYPDFQSRFRNEKFEYFSLDAASPHAFYHSAKSLVAWSDSGYLLKRFKGLKCRKVYFYGDRNSGMKILTELNNIEKRKISKSGHFMMNDNPCEFYSELYNFLHNIAL